MKNIFILHQQPSFLLRRKFYTQLLYIFVCTVLKSKLANTSKSSHLSTKFFNNFIHQKSQVMMITFKLIKFQDFICFFIAEGGVIWQIVFSNIFFCKYYKISCCCTRSIYFCTLNHTRTFKYNKIDNREKRFVTRR